MKQRSLEHSAYAGMLAIATVISLFAAPAFPATKDEVDAAKNEIDLGGKSADSEFWNGPGQAVSAK